MAVATGMLALITVAGVVAINWVENTINYVSKTILDGSKNHECKAI